MHREIGGDYLWWFMADASDADIAMHLTLNYPMGVYKNNRMIGFFEIDGITNYPDARINYLGLKTKYLGKGLGKHLINAAIGWAGLAAGPGGSITLTTNDADHMNALPAYFHAGFEQEKSWIEIWNIPDHLGFYIRNDLRVA